MFNNLIKIKKTNHYQQFIKLQRNLSSKTDSPIDQCLNNLRRLDHSSITNSIYPKDVRSAFVAIKSLNLELLSIPNSISSGKTLIGQMRYQWWRDAINSCYKEDNEESQAPINHPVILALHPVIKRHKLSKYHFNRSNVSILPLDLMICSEEELFKVAHSSNLINETILERVQQTIMKIFDLSLSELNACRATLMDQEHHHSNLFNQALPPTYLDPSIRPLFLSAVEFFS
ncbi:hypothetical protein DFH28DRAFT_1130648 [Melampsora americana]|nr:hypothetical protein DFH28DRAFT_1130648 [Melampsora americana]